MTTRSTTRPRARHSTAAVLLASVVVASGLAGSATASSETPAAPHGQVLGTDSPSAIPGRYIVRLDDGVTSDDVADRAALVADTYGGELGFVYERAFHGFSVSLSESQAQIMATDPAVAQVHQEEAWMTDGQPNGDPDTQYGPDWGADRIDQRFSALSLTYTAPNSASNVSVYVIDDGIRIDHVAFEGRARYGKDVLDGDSIAYQAGCSNHGTAMAGIVTARDVGVTDASTVAVRVVDCSKMSSDSQIMAGLEYVMAEQAKPGAGPGVISYSLSCAGPCAGTNVAAAVNAAISQGIPVVGSVGNHNGDACAYGKQGWASSALTVGAVASTGARWVDSATFGSNWGTCVDLFAPGKMVLTVSGASQSEMLWSNGTSIAAPHVAGVVALALGRDPGLSPSALHHEVLSSATPDKLTDLGAGSPNRLLFNGAPTVPGGSTLAVARQGDGRLRLLAVDKDGRLVSRSQTTASARTWDAWTTAQAPRWTVVAAEAQSNGLLLTAAVRPPSESEYAFTMTQSAIDPTKWVSVLQAPQGLAATAIARNIDGRLDQFLVDSAGRAWFRWQTAPSGGWSTTKPWGDQPLGNMPYGTILRSIAAETNADGKISVVATSTRGEVWHKMQDQAAVSWGGWQQIDGQAKAVALAPNKNGRLELFAVDDAGRIQHRTQTAAGSNSWTPWAPLPVDGLGTERVVSIAAETNADGRISLFATNRVGELREVVQASPDQNAWSAWALLDGAMRP